MKKHVVSKENQIKGIAFIVLLMIFTIYSVLKGYSVYELVSVAKKAHPFYLITGLLMMTIYICCQAFNFRLILTMLQHPKTFTNCIQYAYIGYYFGSITPAASGGQPAQMFYMNKDRVSVAISSITIFFMLFVSQIVLILVPGMLAIIRFPIALQFAIKMKYLLLAGTIVTTGLIIILLFVMFFGRTVPFLLKLFIKLLKRLHLVKKPEELQAKMNQMVLSYWEKARVIKCHPALFLKVLIVSIAEWCSQCMVSYLVYRSFGYHEYGIFDLMTCQALLNISVTAIPVPGSVGVAEKAFLEIFGQFYPSDVLPSAMILSRIINFYLPLIISFIVYLFSHIKFIKQSHLEDD